MSSTGLEVLDTTLQKAHEWLNEIMAALGEKTTAKPCRRCASRAMPLRWRPDELRT